jgi:hypothetical protein
VWRRAVLVPLLMLPLACPSSRSLENDARAPCPTLAASACTRARGLVAAANAFDEMSHDYVLAGTRGVALGRGLEELPAAAFRAVPETCARRDVDEAARLDPSVIDFAFVGVAVDGTLVAPDAELGPFLGEDGPHEVRLVALALVRDLAAATFAASPRVTSSAKGCACARATHFAGGEKMGGMLAYTMAARARDAPVRALDFVRARLSDRHATIAETRVGGLEIDGLDAILAGGAHRPPSFKVTSPVAVAHALYPIADVCGFALPTPEVAPLPMDFGDAPYGTSATRLLHVVNRASIDLHAILGARTFPLPARGTLDLPLTWTPDGDAPGCEVQTREEVVVFLPEDPELAVAPKQQIAHVLEHVRTGRPMVARAEHVELGESRRPNFSATVRDWSCPRDFVLASCRADRAQCSDSARTCSSDGYAVSAAPTANGCHFACSGPAGARAPQFCRFDALMECRLRCPR